MLIYFIIIICKYDTYYFIILIKVGSWTVRNEFVVSIILKSSTYFCQI